MSTIIHTPQGNYELSHNAYQYFSRLLDEQADKVDKLTAELADVKYNHDEILAISNTIKENLFKKIAENRLLTAELDAAKKVIKTLLDIHPEVAGKEIAQAITEAEQSLSYGKKEVCPNCGQSMVIPNLHKCIKKGE